MIPTPTNKPAATTKPTRDPGRRSSSEQSLPHVGRPGAIHLLHWAVVGLLAGILQAATVCGSDYIRWDADNGRVDAHLTDWKLAKVVQEVAQQSGWEVFAEAGLTTRISTEFENQPAGRALELLLGRLNFAIFPGDEGTTRLYIFETTARTARTRVLVRQPTARESSTAVQAALRRVQPEHLAQSHRIDRDSFGTNAVAELIAGLSSKDPEARSASASALGYFGEQASPAIEPLIDALSDEDIRVQLSSTMALGQLGQSPELVLPAFVQGLEAQDAPAVLRAWTASAIGRFGSLPPFYSEQLRPLLQAGLEDPSGMVRLHCGEVLEQLDQKNLTHKVSQ